MVNSAVKCIAFRMMQNCQLVIFELEHPEAVLFLSTTSLIWVKELPRKTRSLSFSHELSKPGIPAWVAAICQTAKNTCGFPGLLDVDGVSFISCRTFADIGHRNARRLRWSSLLACVPFVISPATIQIFSGNLQNCTHAVNNSENLKEFKQFWRLVDSTLQKLNWNILVSHFWPFISGPSNNYMTKTQTLMGKAIEVWSWLDIRAGLTKSLQVSPSDGYLGGWGWTPRQGCHPWRPCPISEADSRHMFQKDHWYRYHCRYLSGYPVSDSR